MLRFQQIGMLTLGIFTIQIEEQRNVRWIAQ